MFLPKKEGGLGIRNFDIFNRALLAKQAWRILTMPKSLMARVLKGKYFPSRHFMDTRVTSSASFTWRSILSVKELIAKGACKVIGDGRDTSIWGEPWIPSLHDCRLQSREVDGYYRVCGLMENGAWKQGVLKENFNSWEVQAINQIPVPMYGDHDAWMWRHSKNGQFSVRSAYIVELMENRHPRPSTSSSTNNVVWNKVWRAKMAPKIKLFGWRLLYNGLPINGNLERRGIRIDKQCPRCGDGKGC